ncbi:MAG TPA: MBL fold metallo-hydrolase [Gemmatimonadales bacterium]|nr:MBL fold metallo-hydrolase [Gemmatimonadales bacterium]
MSPDVLRRRFDFARRYARNAVREGRSCDPIASAPYRPDPSRWPGGRLSAAWLGHATVLLDLWGTRVLTDPALERRIGIGRGLAKLGPRRLIEPALRPRELGPVHLVLLSHAHMDHTDLGTLGRLPRHVPVVVHRGNSDLVRRFRRVYELDWGESVEVDGVEVTSVEVRHWGARMVTDRHRGYGGYLLAKAGRRVLFAGDTADTDAFRRLPAGGPIDLAILPIGAYDPWIANHATPEQAWRMFEESGAEYLLPIHHSTFRLSREPLDEPVRRLLSAADEERDRVIITEVGASWTAP